MDVKVDVAMQRPGTQAESTSKLDWIARRIGPRIRARRRELGITQRELARRIGVSGSFVSRVETGQCPPSVVTLCAIAGELGIPVNDLLSDPGEGRFDRGGGWRRPDSAAEAERH